MLNKKRRRAGKPVSRDELNDLGIGSRVPRDSKVRLINKDGSYNIRREGLNFFRSLYLFHSLLNMRGWQFYLSIFGVFIIFNSLFALVYMMMGESVVVGAASGGSLERFLSCLFFSVQTFTTVGYGHMLPRGVAANLLAMIDVFVGLLTFAVATGLMFARFSRPTARIIFSDSAIIAPYRGISSLQFRMANERSNQLYDVEAVVMYSEIQQRGNRRIRHYANMPLERSKIPSFPLHWNIVHPIDEDSPLAGKSLQDLEKKRVEILVMIKAVDDTFSQTVHTRFSYHYDEIIRGVKFADMFHLPEDGPVSVDLHKLGKVEKIELPETAPAAETS